MSRYKRQTLPASGQRRRPPNGVVRAASAVLRGGFGGAGRLAIRRRVAHHVDMCLPRARSCRPLAEIRVAAAPPLAAGVALAILAACDGTEKTVPVPPPPPPMEVALVDTFTHPIDFYIPSIWYDRPDTSARLAKYVDDINVIFAKSTKKRFSLGSVVRRDLPAPTQAQSTTVPLVGVYHYAVMPDSDIGSLGVSNGGSAGGQVEGREGQNELTVLGLHWRDIWSASDLSNEANADDYYRRQIVTLVHELGHLHGLASSEYYSLMAVDATSSDATYSQHLENLTQIPKSAYWQERPLAFDDPMRGCQFATCMFGPLSSLIIDRAASGFYDSQGCNRGYYRACTAVTEQTLTVKAESLNTGSVLSGCAVRVYGTNANNEATSSTLHSSGQTDAEGLFTFASTLSDASSANKYLLRIDCPPFEPQARWLTIFDLQASQQGVPNGGAVGDFGYPGSILFRLAGAEVFGP